MNRPLLKRNTAFLIYLFDDRDAYCRHYDGMDCGAEYGMRRSEYIETEWCKQSEIEVSEWMDGLDDETLRRYVESFVESCERKIAGLDDCMEGARAALNS